MITSARYERGGMILLLTGSTLGTLCLIAPLRSAVVWAVAAASLCGPVHHWFTSRVSSRPNVAAGLTLGLIILMVLLPALLVFGALITEVSTLLAQQGRGMHLPKTLEQAYALLPGFIRRLLLLTGSDDLSAVRSYAVRLLQGGVLALFGGAVGLGQSAFNAAVTIGVMIYTSFFFIRDGRQILASIVDHLPLSVPIRERLVAELRDVLRATLRGSLVVALVQGTLGGLVFAALGIPAPLVWGFAMAVMALLPPFGASVIWAPVSLFLLVTGSVWQALVLIVCGLLLIGLIDNFLRPVLVGREARLPEYLVLLSTLGGLTVFGIDGIILGPVIVAVFLVSWRALRRERGAI
jgi:predicted PurR-regulated permease PerM